MGDGVGGGENIVVNWLGCYLNSLYICTMRVLIACEYSGTVRDAFIAKGHNAMSCDILDTESPGPHYKGNALDVLNDGWDMMIAHPPCTYFANSGLHYLKTRPGRKELLYNSFAFVLQLWNAPIERIAIENPTGWLNTNWRKPSQIIQPYYFGDPHLKTTCLWLKHLPRLAGLKEVAMNERKYRPQPMKTLTRKTGEQAGQPYNYYWRQGKSAKDRAKTFPGIANAMAEQWNY
jgi:hypothetical protein